MGRTLARRSIAARYPTPARPWTRLMLKGSWQFDGDTVSVRATAQGGLRSYTLSSTHTQRDQRRASVPSTSVKATRSFAWGAADRRPLCDGGRRGWNGGTDQRRRLHRRDRLLVTKRAPVELGLTRDIAYRWARPADRPQRTPTRCSSSHGRAGGGLQIVQDTGTGETVVSTDRVTCSRRHGGAAADRSP